MATDRFLAMTELGDSRAKNVLWQLLMLEVQPGLNRARGHRVHEAVMSVCVYVFRGSVVLVAPYKANMVSSPAKATASGVEEESNNTSSSV